MSQTDTAVLPIAHFLGLAPNMRKIEQSLGGALKVERFMQLAMNTIRRTDKLLECTPESVLASLTQAAELQLYPGNNLGHAYLVPFWDKKAGAQQCTYILGYKGMVALCHRSPNVLKVEAHLVYEGDKFSCAHGDGEHLVHEPDYFGDRDTMLGAYAQATLANGTKITKVLNMKELEAAKRRSKASSYGPWVTDFGAMCMKTAVRRLAPWLPLEPSDQVAVAEDMEKEYGDAVEEPREVAAEDVSPEDLISELAGDVVDMINEEPEQTPRCTEEQRNRLLDWLQSEHVDPHALRSYMRDCFGEAEIESLSEEQAQEVLNGVESGDFAPATE